VNRVTIAEIETGRKQGSITTLRALSDALGVSLDDLPRTVGQKRPVEPFN
jgi:mRNA interferase RelE/StbE